MAHDLYTRLAAEAARVEGSEHGPGTPNGEDRRFPPGTIYTASIETIDNDWAGALLVANGP
jgi:hypothetical protein